MPSSLRVLLDQHQTPDRRFLLFVLVVTVALRIAWIASVPVEPVSDYRWYLDRAISLASGDGYVASDGSPTAYFPVGYPAFLALIFLVCGSSVFAAKLANVLLSAGTIAMLYSLAQGLITERRGPTRIRRLAAILLAFFPSQILYVSLLSDSILFQFLLYLGLLSLAVPSWWRNMAGGLVFGLATLTRPYAFFVPLLAAAFLWAGQPGQRRLGNLALVYLVLLLVVTPWTLRNARVFGGFVPVSNNGGINLLIGNGTGANGQYRENALPPGEGRLLGEYEKGRLAARLAAQSILGDPMRFVRLVPQKVLRMYADDAQAIRWNLKGMSGRASNGRYGFWDYAAMAVVQAYYGLVLLAFVACLISSYSAKRFRERIHPLGLSLVLYFTVVAIVFFGDPRFHFPLVPVFCLYAAQMLFSRSCGDDQAFSETTSA